MGITFLTDSDTEVLLQAYKHYGETCLHKFNGMWAFAIYDRAKDIIFCARDRFGIKPFVYYHSEDEFIFSSEAKAIITFKPELKKPNLTAIANYVRNSYGAQGTETWFENIHRLLPGHAIRVGPKSFEQWEYYQYPETKIKLSFEAAKEQYKDLFMDAVKLRMRSDVPVGTTLSSGVDSSSIIVAMRTLFQGNLYTYTAYFANNLARKGVYKNLDVINEEDTVHKLERDISLNAEYVLVDNDDYLVRLKEIVYALESGHCSTAIIPIERVYKGAT
jgi:asparagine synthase (glutamine-hydrolysing)